MSTSSTIPDRGLGGVKLARGSLLMLFALPVVLIGGFVVGSLLGFGPEAHRDGMYWVKFVGFAIAVLAPFAVGMIMGALALRRGERGAMAGLVSNAIVFLFMFGVTVLGTLLEG